MNAIEIEYKCDYKYFVRHGCDFKFPKDITNPMKCDWYWDGHCTCHEAQLEAIKED